MTASPSRVIVIGSGPGGATAAQVLAEAGHDVVIFEKGRNYFTDLEAELPGTVFSSDELKNDRGFAEADPIAEPRSFRTSIDDREPYVGQVQSLPQTVGGGAVHWDAKTPRLWDIDFKKASLLGPQPAADVEDWPFSYEELVPYYEAVEALIGVAGDRQALPELTLRHAPRSAAFPMPPGPPQYSSLLAAKGAAAVGLHPFPSAMAINSREYAGRPACNNCGFCTGYGCPILARIGALAPLRRALLAGAELRDRSMVVRVGHDGKRANGVVYLDDRGRMLREGADAVVLAGNAIESSRLALMSELPDPHDMAGRHIMFHWFTDGSGIFLDERLHAHRGRDHTHDIDDFADPDFPGARAAAKKAGLPYFRAGKIEMGGTDRPLDEAHQYQQILPVLSPHKPFGHEFKALMRSSLLRDRLLGLTLMGEDLPYASNRVDLDPSVRDWRGYPVARITYGPGKHELAAQEFYMPWMVKLLKAAGAEVAIALPDQSSKQFPIGAGSVVHTEHLMGGMRMGSNPRTSVTDGEARHHYLDNVFVADGGAFTTSGGHNPTLTIMATAMRNATRWASAL
jgi:choline dehydrogenase-like flavoprotein